MWSSILNNFKWWKWWMNFEQLCEIFFFNKRLLKNKKFFIFYLKYRFECLKEIKKKLKLGSIVFEIKEYKIGNTVLPNKEKIEIIFINQDNTDEEELKLENRLNALNWKWDIYNILSLFLILFIFYNLIYLKIYDWYCLNFPELANKNQYYEFIFKESIDLSLNSNIKNNFVYSKVIIKIIKPSIDFLINNLIDLFIDFNLIS